jgi:hypothetical protein
VIWSCVSGPSISTVRSRFGSVPNFRAPSHRQA